MVSDNIAKYTINRVIPSQIQSKEGFIWVIFDIDFYNNSDVDQDDYVPNCFLVYKDQYFNSYSKSLKIAKNEKINSKILFEVPDNQKEFDFYCDYIFNGSTSNINDDSRSIVRVKL
jgi:hypothetical protein